MNHYRHLTIDERENARSLLEQSFSLRAITLKLNRYVRMRWISKVSEQCLLTAAVQNMKKIANILYRHYSSLIGFFRFYSLYFTGLLFFIN